MDYKQIMKDKLINNPERIEHTLNVLERALEFGKLYNANLNTLEVASLLHDITKDEPNQYHARIIKNKRYLKNTPSELWHAKSASIFAEEIGIKDKNIINAIKNHSFGSKRMSLETLILVLADYTEKGREFAEAKEVYDIALKNLYEAYLTMIENTFLHLKEMNKKITKKQIKVYNYIKRRYKS